MMEKLDFRYEERKDWVAEAFDESYRKLYDMNQRVKGLIIRSRQLEEEQTELEQNIILMATELNEEIEEVARRFGRTYTLEDVDFFIEPRTMNFRNFRETRGEEGISYGSPQKTHIKYIKVFEFYFVTSRNYFVEYCFSWPDCNCEIYDKLHLIDIKVEGQGILTRLLARTDIGTDEVFPFPEGTPIISRIEGEIGRLFGEGFEDGKLRCPKCQTCSMDLDYECDGYEDIEPLAEFIPRQRDKDLIRKWTGRRHG
jgi:hypothetical protein